ncbi:MAG: nucleotidyltransferase family protein [Deltaproteobacteria bacterium]|nr:nucleotidyltransferase family protein [Deltaproteobacteria bacterium]
MERIVGGGPEQELLLWCAKLGSDEEGERTIEHLLRQRLDWAYLVRMSDSHGMTPLLYSKIRRLRPRNIPNDVLSRMRGSYRFSAWRSVWCTQKLIGILDLLSSRGIEAIPFKGPALARILYENPALRSFGDLDLLVRRRDLDESKQVLLSSGYHLEFDQDRLPPHEFHLTFVDRQGIPIEIHWALARTWYFFGIDMDRFWERKETTLLAGKPVPMISPEDLLLALSVHGVRHHWRSLRWVCDIGRWVERYKERDLFRTLSRVKTISQRRILLLSLFLASELTGVEIPETVHRAARTDPIVPSLASWVRGQMFSDTENLSWRLKSKWFYFRLTSGAHRKCRLLLSMLGPTPTDVTYRRLPPALSVFYFMIRPIRFIRECELWSSSHH